MNYRGAMLYLKEQGVSPEDMELILKARLFHWSKKNLDKLCEYIKEAHADKKVFAFFKEIANDLNYPGNSNVLNNFKVYLKYAKVFKEKPYIYIVYFNILKFYQNNTVNVDQINRKVCRYLKTHVLSNM